MNIIDISRWQGTPNFAQVKSTGVKGVYMKATEGASTVDPQLTSNFNGASSVGLETGFYHYGHSTEDPKLQAEFFWNTVKSLGNHGDFPLILDLEVTDGHDATFLDSWATTFLAHLEAISVHDVGWYSGEWFATTYLPNTIKKFSFAWVAKYSDTAPSIHYSMWQYSQSGTVSGIYGHVDLDKGVDSELVNTASYTTYNVVVKDRLLKAINVNGDTYVIWGALDVLGTPYTYEGNGKFNINGTDVQGVVFNGDSYIIWSKLATGIHAYQAQFLFSQN